MMQLSHLAAITAIAAVYTIPVLAQTPNTPNVTNSNATQPFKQPTQGLPVLLKHALPLHDVIKVDLHVPGCPPSAPTILFVLTELLAGRIPDLRGARFG